MMQQVLDSLPTVAFIAVAYTLVKYIKDYDADDDDDSSEYSDSSDGSAPSAILNNYGLLDAPYKMVLVVNMELGMGKGKIAAQCGHATLGAYKKARRCAKTAVTWWERTGQAKIATKGKDLAFMLDVQEKARSKGLVTYLVADAGHTQIAPGSKTVLCIGPAPVSAFTGITDECKLL